MPRKLCGVPKNKSLLSLQRNTAERLLVLRQSGPEVAQERDAGLTRPEGTSGRASPIPTLIGRDRREGRRSRRA
jgi:hypothetical protein